MDKIWIIKSPSRYTKKFTVYKNEGDLLKAISVDSNLEILEYELKSSVRASDYIKSKDRDIQLRSVLGELSDDEIAIEKFITLFEHLAPVGKEYVKKYWEGNNWVSFQTSSKDEFLKKLKKFSTDKKQIVKIITDNKKYLISKVSQEVEWYVSILRLHNFRDYVYDSPNFNRETRKYEKVDTATDEIKNNFKLAKEELKKLRKKKV
jgi:hypothetical protein